MNTPMMGSVTNRARALRGPIPPTVRRALHHQAEAVSLVRAFNVVITNVPGPPFPLYLLGAKLDSIFPLVPLFENQGVGIALFSYDGGLYWGLAAD